MFKSKSNNKLELMKGLILIIFLFTFVFGETNNPSQKQVNFSQLQEQLVIQRKLFSDNKQSESNKLNAHGKWRELLEEATKYKEEGAKILIQEYKETKGNNSLNREFDKKLFIYIVDSSIANLALDSLLNLEDNYEEQKEFLEILRIQIYPHSASQEEFTIFNNKNEIKVSDKELEITFDSQGSPIVPKKDTEIESLLLRSRAFRYYGSTINSFGKKLISENILLLYEKIKEGILKNKICPENIDFSINVLSEISQLKYLYTNCEKIENVSFKRLLTDYRSPTEGYLRLDKGLSLEQIRKQLTSASNEKDLYLLIEIRKILFRYENEIIKVLFDKIKKENFDLEKVILISSIARMSKVETFNKLLELCKKTGVNQEKYYFIYSLGVLSASEDFIKKYLELNSMVGQKKQISNKNRYDVKKYIDSINDPTDRRMQIASEFVLGIMGYVEGGNLSIDRVNKISDKSEKIKELYDLLRKNDSGVFAEKEIRRMLNSKEAFQNEKFQELQALIQKNDPGEFAIKEMKSMLNSKEAVDYLLAKAKDKNERKYLEIVVEILSGINEYSDNKVLINAVKSTMKDLLGSPETKDIVKNACMMLGVYENNTEKKSPKTVSNHISKPQILYGIESSIKSLDVYLKGAYNYMVPLGENCELNGSVTLCTFPAVSQYPSKSSGYLMLYEKTKQESYLKMSEQFIDRIYSIYTNTKDKNGKNWIPTQELVAKDGKSYGYGSFPQYNRYLPENQLPIGFDQSKATFKIESAGFPDAFGIGLWELTKKKELLSKEYRKKVSDISNCLLDFTHREYMLSRKSEEFYYRTSDFEPLNPKMPIPPAKWSCMGSEAIYSALALLELGENADKWDFQLTNFLRYYIKDRSKHDSEQRINYLDNRILDLCEYFKRKNKNQDLIDSVIKKLSYEYKNKSTKAVFMQRGSLKDFSSIPFLEIYRKLGLKVNFRELFNDIWVRHFDEEQGILDEDGKPVIVNGSGYHVLVDYSYAGWKSGIISDEEFLKAINKYNMFKGNKRNTRNIDDFVLDCPPADKKLPNWISVPFDCFLEGVESESYYKDGAQAFLVDYKFTDAFTKEPYYQKNTYFQFSAAFQDHAEPIRYGQAITCNIIELSSLPDFQNVSTRTYTIKGKFPDVPKGTICAGVLDITDKLYYGKSNFRNKEEFVTQVLVGGMKQPFGVYQLIEYEKTRSEIDHSKLVFLSEKSNDIDDIVITFTNKYKIQESNPSDYLKQGYIGRLEGNRLRFFPEYSEQLRSYNPIIDKAFEKVIDIVKEKEFKNMEDTLIRNWQDFGMAYSKSISETKANPVESKKIVNFWENNLRDYLIEINGDTKIENVKKRLGSLLEIYVYILSISEFKPSVSLSLKEQIESDIQTIDRTYSELELFKDFDASILLAKAAVLLKDDKSVNRMYRGIKGINEYLFKLKEVNGEDKISKDFDFLVRVSELIKYAYLQNITFSDYDDKLSMYYSLLNTRDAYEALDFFGSITSPDGCLSSAVSDKKENIREMFYWWTKVFPAFSDESRRVRYFAFGGTKLPYVELPQTESKCFPQYGIYVLKTGSDIRQTFNIVQEEQYSKLRKESGKTMYEKARMLIFNSNNGKWEFLCEGTPALLNLEDKDTKVQIKKWEISEDLDILETETEEKCESFVLLKKPGFWFINMRPKDTSKGKLKLLTTTQEMNYEKNKHNIYGELVKFQIKLNQGKPVNAIRETMGGGLNPLGVFYIREFTESPYKNSFSAFENVADNGYRSSLTYNFDAKKDNLTLMLIPQRAVESGVPLTKMFDGGTSSSIILQIKNGEPLRLSFGKDGAQVLK